MSFEREDPASRHAMTHRQMREFGICKLFLDEHSVVVDAGANVGRYARALSRVVRKCIAFEPHPGSFEQLRAQASGNCEVHNLALSNRDGWAQLATPVSSGAEHLELASLQKTTADAFTGMVDLPPDYSISVQRVATRRLDSVFREAELQLIKVDVEGHELEVLDGAIGCIRRFRPVIYVELEDQHRPGVRAEVTALLTGLDYRGYFIDDRKLSPLARFSAERHQNLRDYDLYVRNFLFLP